MVRLDLRVVFCSEHHEWIAHCLEFDLLGSGVSKEVALASLNEAFFMQVQATEESRNIENLIVPAPAEFLQRFETGTDVVVRLLPFEDTDVVVIEGVSTRECAVS
jgi:hypothetical protein